MLTLVFFDFLLDEEADGLCETNEDEEVDEDEEGDEDPEDDEDLLPPPIQVEGYLDKNEHHLDDEDGLQKLDGLMS